jgi:2-polyprenyl-3-methyl-5-hydroxy-6-metoxy-1,4-benzoquinol methylase
MKRHWSANKTCLEIEEMPFYWRLSTSADAIPDILPRLPISVKEDENFDYLRYAVGDREWSVIDAAYKKNENIGFLNTESGQLHTYGSSVNNFFLDTVAQFSPRNIYEIGCGAGHSIQYLNQNGWKVTGIDPSEYSLMWSQELGFPLINDFFSGDLMKSSVDFIYCNDVFEHVRDVDVFSKEVFDCLNDGGVFCFATTNSTNSIAIGDISMLEHQHVNMFTELSIYQILNSAGFSVIHVKKGAYGNTFHVIAQKRKGIDSNTSRSLNYSRTCPGFFERARQKLIAFENFYNGADDLHCYVPLRCMPYLASVGDYGKSHIYDSNIAWQGKYLDGYSKAIRSQDDIVMDSRSKFFIGSMTFAEEIRGILKAKGILEQQIYSIEQI